MDQRSQCSPLEEGGIGVDGLGGVGVPGRRRCTVLALRSRGSGFAGGEVAAEGRGGSARSPKARQEEREAGHGLEENYQVHTPTP